MREEFLLETPYKNSRKYVHSSDIYHQVIEIFRKKGIHPERFELTFRKVQCTKPLVIIDDNPQNKSSKTLCSTIKFLNGKKQYYGCIYESQIEVDSMITVTNKLENRNLIIHKSMECVVLSNGKGCSLIDVLLKLGRILVQENTGNKKMEFFLRKISIRETITILESEQVSISKKKFIKDNIFFGEISLDGEYFGEMIAVKR